MAKFDWGAILAEAQRDGMGPSDVAKKYGCSKVSVHKELRRRGMNLPHSKNVRISAEWNHIIATSKQEGWSTLEAATHFNKDRGQLTVEAKKRGVVLPVKRDMVENWKAVFSEAALRGETYRECAARINREYNYVIAQAAKLGVSLAKAPRDHRPERCEDGSYRVPLGNNVFARIDAEDCDRIGIHAWYCLRTGIAQGYAVRHVANDETILMHREVMYAPNDLEVDHVNRRFTLDNRKENLRLASHQQNSWNTINRRRFKGATKERTKWLASITKANVCYRIGRYDTAEEAAAAYNVAAVALFGEFAYLNETQAQVDIAKVHDALAKPGVRKRQPAGVNTEGLENPEGSLDDSKGRVRACGGVRQRMYVQTLTTNFASPDGKPHTFQLGSHVLLRAKNGGGKSAIVSTPIRLILSGSADDVGGRDDVRDPQLLAQYVSSPSGELYAHLTMDDGVQGAWGTVRESDGTIKKPRHEPPPGIDTDRVLPLRAIQAVLKGDEKVARRTFLGWIGQKTTEEDVLALVPSHLRAKYRDIAEKQSGSVTDRLIAVVEYAKLRARQIESDATAQDALINSLGQSLEGPQPSKEDVEQARTLASQWAGALALAMAWEGRVPVDTTAATQAVEQATQAVAQWEAVLADRVAKKPVQPVAQSNPSSARHEKSAGLLDEATCTSGTCPTCGAVPGPDSLTAWAAYHRSQAEAGGIDPAALDAYKNAEIAWLQSTREAQEAISQWRAVLATNREALARAGGAAATTLTDPGFTSDQARESLTQAQTRQIALERSASAHETVKAARDTAALLRSDKPIYEEFVKYCMSAVTELLEGSTQSFCKSVQQYLPERWQVGMRLHDQGKEVFQIGYWRNDVLHTLLSGTERDALCVAIAMVIAGLGGGVAPAVKKKGRPPARTTNGFFLVIPEDRDRDGETLGELMRAWSKFPGQVILEATDVPTGRFPKGWTLLDMDEWRKPFEVKAEAGDKVGGSGGEVKVEQGGGGPAGSTLNAETAAPAVSPPATPPLEKLWYHHTESDAYIQMTEAEWYAREDRADLEEIEGTDDGAPDRHRAEQDDPNIPPAAVSGAEIQDHVEALKSMSHKEENIAQMGPKLRALLVDEKIPGPSVILVGNSLVIYDAKNKPSRTLPLGQ